MKSSLVCTYNFKSLPKQAIKIIHNFPQLKLTSASTLWHSKRYAIMYLRSLAKSSTSFERKIDSPRKMSFSPAWTQIKTKNHGLVLSDDDKIPELRVTSTRKHFMSSSAVLFLFVPRAFWGSCDLMIMLCDKFKSASCKTYLIPVTCWMEGVCPHGRAVSYPPIYFQTIWFGPALSRTQHF